MVQAISMEEPKQKLQKLGEFIPGAAHGLIEFGKFLAGYLNPELLPEGFILGCTLAAFDLNRGVNGYTGKPIQNELTGNPVSLFDLLEKIPEIADAIFPEEFAKEVRDALMRAISKAEE